MTVIPFAFGAAVWLAAAQAPEPVARPARPTPNWSWDTLGGTLAFHGANKTGMYTDAAVAQLAKYAMVTLEKWYTPCASKGPVQAGPECDVEAAMFETFAQLRKLNPDITLVMYWNSMFDFAFYKQHQAMLDLEAAGTHAFLRDERGEVASLCNDGNVYCNITTFDHTVPQVRLLWEDQVRNAVANGSVDGIFADHAYNNPKPLNDHPSVSQLCNGAGPGRRCFNFTAAFGERFVASHTEMLNYTQDLLSKTTKGPVICGPYSRWNLPTDFERLRPIVQRGQTDLTAPFVLEASKSGCSVGGDENALAGFLCAMEKYTYLSCFSSTPPPWFAAFDKPLGAPVGPAVQLNGDVWQRNFSNFKGTTTATFNAGTKKGSIWWAGDPPPPPSPPPAPPTPAPAPAPYCTTMPNTGLAEADLGLTATLESAAACCAYCHEKASHGCVAWAWHHETGGDCHLHTTNAWRHTVKGCVAGYTNKTTMMV